MIKLCWVRIGQRKVVRETIKPVVSVNIRTRVRDETDLVWNCCRSELIYPIEVYYRYINLKR